MKFYIQKITIFALIFLLAIALPVLSACSESSLDDNVESEESFIEREEGSLITADDEVDSPSEDKSGKSNRIISKLKGEVTFLDVGEGDCIFIVLPDGKCALIDCGNQSDTLAQNIEEYIKSKGFSKIDYFILTHPDIDHVGNANYLIDKFDIGEAFIPDVVFDDVFPLLTSIKNNLTQKQVPVKYNEKYKSIVGENYAFCFLSPESIIDSNGAYKDLDPFNPDDSHINDISAVIYFKCIESSFLFTGDAGTKIESKIISNYGDGLFERAFNAVNIPQDKRVKVTLEDVDFLKVSHHGAADATSTQFLSRINPKHAIFSVGGNNIYGHPDSSTLKNFALCVPECKIWRTDTLGHIAIRIYDDNSYKILSQK